MLTYVTLEGDVYDLTGLSDEERTFYEGRVTAYRAGERWAEFARAVEGTANPLIRATGGRITRAVLDHPLYRATRDLEDRLGIQQGKVGPSPGDDPASDPFQDEWIPVHEAATRKGVTVPGLHGAIRRGQVTARPAKPGGSRLLVSLRSLNRWTPNAIRQAARRKMLPAREETTARSPV